MTCLFGRNELLHKQKTSSSSIRLPVKHYNLSHDWGCELNIGYPVTGHEIDDRFTNTVNGIQKFVD